MTGAVGEIYRMPFSFEKHAVILFLLFYEEDIRHIAMAWMEDFSYMLWTRLQSYQGAFDGIGPPTHSISRRYDFLLAVDMPRALFSLTLPILATDVSLPHHASSLGSMPRLASLHFHIPPVNPLRQSYNMVFFDGVGEKLSSFPNLFSSFSLKISLPLMHPRLLFPSLNNRSNGEGATLIYIAPSLYDLISKREGAMGRAFHK